jgi:hypothetical protein
LTKVGMEVAVTEKPAKHLTAAKLPRYFSVRRSDRRATLSLKCL